MILPPEKIAALHAGELVDIEGELVTDAARRSSTASRSPASQRASERTPITRRMLVLPKEARQVLAELELCMHGKVTSWNATTRGGDDPSRPPQGELNPPHLLWRLRMERCTTAELPGLIEAARVELASIKRRDITIAVQEESRGAWESRLIREGEGFDARTVANRFRCAVVDVTKLRKLHGRDPNMGYLVGSPHEQARRLRDQGLNQQEIARLMEVSQPTVSRLLAA